MSELIETNEGRLEIIKKKAETLLFHADEVGNGNINVASVYKDLKWLIEQVESVQEIKNEKQTALEALKIVDEITEKMLMDCDHAAALGAYFNPSAEDLASDIGSVVLEALEKMNEDVTEGQERVIERKYNIMFEALKWIEECSVDYQSINKAKNALGVKS